MRPLIPLSVIGVWLFLAAISAPTTVRGDILYDTSGKPLRQGVPYYIVPANSESAGGVVPLTRSNNVTKVLCPLDCALSANPSNPGSPVYLESTSRVAVLQTTDIIQIEFGPGFWPCTLSKFWRTRYSPSSEQTFISTGGASDKPNSQFKIQVEGDAYKIVHYSTDLSDDGDYRSAGVFTDNSGVKRLILSEKPLPVKFESVFDTHSAL